MELDEMKLAWQALEHRLERQQVLHRRIYRESRLDKLRHGLRPLAWGQGIQLAFGVLFVLLGIGYWTTHSGTAHQLVLGVLVQAFGIVMIVFSARNLALIQRIDYAAPVLDIQRRLLELRAWRVRVEGPVFAVIGSFIWIPLLLLEWDWQLGVDVWVRWPAFVGWLVICGCVSLALVLLVFGLVRWTGRLRWIQDNAAGKGVTRAQAMLSEIVRFERE